MPGQNVRVAEHLGDQEADGSVVVPPVLKPPPPPVRGGAHAPSKPRPAGPKHVRKAPSPAHAPSIPKPGTTRTPVAATPAPAPAPPAPVAPVAPLAPPPPPAQRVPPAPSTSTESPGRAALARIAARNAARLERESQPDLHVPHAKQMKTLAASVAATAVAWVFLVVRAIGFGRDATDSGGAAWVFLFLATLGATACMFLGIILGNKLRLLLKGEAPAQPVRTPGGRRAAR